MSNVFRVVNKTILSKKQVIGSKFDVIKAEKDRMVKEIIKQIEKNKDNIFCISNPVEADDEIKFELVCDITIVPSELMHKMIKILGDVLNGRDIDLSELREVMEELTEKENKRFKVNDGFKEFVKTLNIYDLLQLRDSLKEYSEDKEFLYVVLEEIKERGEYLKNLEGGNDA